MSVRKTATYTLSFVTLFCLLEVICYNSRLAFLVYPSTFLALFCGALFLFRVAPYERGKLTFIVLVVGNYLFFTDRFGAMLSSLMGASVRVFTYPYAATLIGLLLLTFIPFILFMGWLWSKIRDLQDVSWWRLSLVPSGFILLFLMMDALHMAGLVIGWALPAAYAMIIVCTLVVYWQIADGLAKADDAARFAERLRSTDNQLRLQAELLRGATAHEGEIKQIRHNMRHHFTTLETMLANNDISRAMAYLHEYIGKVEETVSPPVCKNAVADAICRRYIALAGQMGIKVDVAADIPEQIGVEDSDLSVLLGNLWENAFEACMRQSEGERFIQLRAKVTDNSLMISMTNSFDGVTRVRDGKDGETVLLSLKRGGDKEGVGISSVRAITKRYNGLSEIAYESDRFNVRVLLYSKCLPHLQ